MKPHETSQATATRLVVAVACVRVGVCSERYCCPSMML